MFGFNRTENALISERRNVHESRLRRANRPAGSAGLRRSAGAAAGAERRADPRRRHVAEPPGRLHAGRLARHPHHPAAGAGRDIAGEVAELGAEVQGFQVGDRVVASGAGSYAEYAVAPAERTFHLPATCSFDEAGAAAHRGADRVPDAGQPRPRAAGGNGTGDGRRQRRQQLRRADCQGRGRARHRHRGERRQAESGAANRRRGGHQPLHGGRERAGAGPDRRRGGGRDHRAHRRRGVAGLFPQPRRQRPPGDLRRHRWPSRRPASGPGVHPRLERHGGRPRLTRRHARTAAPRRPGARAVGHSPTLFPAGRRRGAPPAGKARRFSARWFSIRSDRSASRSQAAGAKLRHQGASARLRPAPGVP